MNMWMVPMVPHSEIPPSRWTSKTPFWSYQEEIHPVGQSIVLKTRGAVQRLGFGRYVSMSPSPIHCPHTPPSPTDISPHKHEVNPPPPSDLPPNPLTYANGEQLFVRRQKQCPKFAKAFPNSALPFPNCSSTAMLKV